MAKSDYLMGRRDVAAEALQIVRRARMAGKDAGAEVERWLASERAAAAAKLRAGARARTD